MGADILVNTVDFFYKKLKIIKLNSLKGLAIVTTIYGNMRAVFAATNGFSLQCFQMTIRTCRKQYKSLIASIFDGAYLNL